VKLLLQAILFKCYVCLEIMLKNLGDVCRPWMEANESASPVVLRLVQPDLSVREDLGTNNRSQ
jgi:hypothetical protein